MYDYDDSWQRVCYACAKPIRSVTHVYPDSDKTDPWYFAEPVFQARRVELDLEPYTVKLLAQWGSKEDKLRTVLGEFDSSVQGLQKELLAKLSILDDDLPLAHTLVDVIRNSLDRPLGGVMNGLIRQFESRHYGRLLPNSWQDLLKDKLEDGICSHLRHTRGVLCLDNYVKFNVHASCFSYFNPSEDKVKYKEIVKEESFRKTTECFVEGFSHQELFLIYIDCLVGCGRISKEKESQFRSISAEKVTIDFELKEPDHYEDCEKCKGSVKRGE